MRIPWSHHRGVATDLVVVGDKAHPVNLSDAPDGIKFYRNFYHDDIWVNLQCVLVPHNIVNCIHFCRRFKLL